MDIVERLRWSGQDAMTKHLSLGMWKLHDEAATEIERLRTNMNDALKLLCMGHPGPEERIWDARYILAMTVSDTLLPKEGLTE